MHSDVGCVLLRWEEPFFWYSRVFAEQCAFLDQVGVEALVVLCRVYYGICARVCVLAAAYCDVGCAGIVELSMFPLSCVVP